MNPSPSAGRVRGLKGSTHLSPVHALHFGLADWVSTPAPRQCSANTQLTTLFTHALTLSAMGIRLRRKNPTHLESNPRLSHPKRNRGTPTPPGRGGCIDCCVYCNRLHVGQIRSVRKHFYQRRLSNPLVQKHKIWDRGAGKSKRKVCYSG